MLRFRTLPGTSITSRPRKVSRRFFRPGRDHPVLRTTASALRPRNIHRLFPDLRIVLTIRNPVDRIWSNAGLDFHRYGNRDLEDPEYRDLRAVLPAGSAPVSTPTTNGSSTAGAASSVKMRCMSRSSTASQAKPAAMLKRIFRHLGADPGLGTALGAHSEARAARGEDPPGSRHTR